LGAAITDQRKTTNKRARSAEKSGMVVSFLKKITLAVRDLAGLISRRYLDSSYGKCIELMYQVLNDSYSM
jgi:hypothetical protein